MFSFERGIIFKLWMCVQTEVCFHFNSVLFRVIQKWKNHEVIKPKISFPLF